MTAKKKSGSSHGPSDSEKKARLTLEEARRLVEEARKRGDDPGPIIKRLVLQVIEDVQEDLEAEGRVS